MPRTAHSLFRDPAQVAPSALEELQRLQVEFGAAAAARKLELLRRLARARLRTAEQVKRLHEALCVLRAYPDNARVLAAVERALAAFARRADLRAHRDALYATGIAGTTLWFPFFYPTARWLAARWPALLRFDRSDTAAGDHLARALPLLVTRSEAQAVRNLPGYAAIDLLRAKRTTDATFLVRRVEAMPGSEATREAFYDAINPSCELLPAADTPARTHAKLAGMPIVYRSTPPVRARPDLRRELARPPVAVRALSARAGREVIALARCAMATRQRDLDAFAYGDARAVTLVDDGAGLAFAFNGMQTERRAPIAAIYGGLILRNGVPVGYAQADLVGRAAALAFNVFETFRGLEAPFLFARCVAALHHAFGATMFSIEPYQLGAGNDEALDSGAWWFYFKLGFRPRDAATRALARAELARLRADPKHRSDRAALAQLARRHLFFEADPGRPTPLPPLAAIGGRVARKLSLAAGADRERAVDLCERALRAHCGIASRADFTAGERWAWRQWAPLAALLDLARWSTGERAALVALVRAKGGRDEREYVARFAAHARLQRELFGGALSSRAGTTRP
jgi:hypothetical protein